MKFGEMETYFFAISLSTLVKLQGQKNLVKI